MPGDSVASKILANLYTGYTGLLVDIQVVSGLFQMLLP